MLRPLETVIAAVRKEDPQARLLFVGDYVNRGPDSKGVIDLLLKLEDAQCVRGNHDDIFDQVLHDQTYAGQSGEEHRKVVFQWFMQHGLDATFKSYGVQTSELARAMRKPDAGSLQYLANLIPQAHRKFIRELPPVFEDQDLFVAHAKWEAMVPSENPGVAERLAAAHQSVHYTLLWGRYGLQEIGAQKPWQRTGYFGHTPVDMYSERPDLVPVIGPQIALLDTAAALSPRGRLTAFCHDTQNFIQADAMGRLTV
jgi:hypothetical protein